MDFFLLNRHLKKGTFIFEVRVIWVFLAVGIGKPIFTEFLA